jgi:hypothetical protein
MKKLGYHAKQRELVDQFDYTRILIEKTGYLTDKNKEKALDLCWTIVDKSDSVPFDIAKGLIKCTLKRTFLKVLRRRAELN